MENKKLRWYCVDDWEYLNVVSAYSHSRAKLMYNSICGAEDDWTALKEWRASVIKIELDEIAEKEWELYMDNIELLKKWIYHHCTTEENCLSCGEYCWESNPQYYDQEKEKFTCRHCKK